MSDAEVDAFIALGSNIGDRRGTLATALRELDETPGVRVVTASDMIETEAVGPGDQTPYLNAAAHLRTDLPPRPLLDRMLDLERRHGRIRKPEERWAARTLDLDLLLYGDHVIAEPGLHVPHPHMHRRLFVLGPLAAIAPKALHPVLGRTASELLSVLEADKSGMRTTGSVLM